MEVSNVFADVRDRSPYMSPVIIADMPCQIREIIALGQSLREEFRRSSLVASSLGPSSPSGFSTREPSEARLTSETSRISRTVFLCLHLNRVFWAVTFKESLSDLLLVCALM